MKQEKQTRENLIKAAKEEFMEKSYASASLRSICKKAGVTTGALYFFFKDKEELFGAIVDAPLDQLYEFIRSHYSYELSVNNMKIDTEGNFDAVEDFKITEIVTNYLYQYYDEFILIMDKSQGSKYENVFNDIVNMTEKHYRIIADRVAETIHAKRMDDYMVHWFSHVQIYSFAHLLTHEKDKEKAKKEIVLIVKALIGGWFSVFGK